MRRVLAHPTFTVHCSARTRSGCCVAGPCRRPGCSGRARLLSGHPFNPREGLGDMAPGRGAASNVGAGLGAPDLQPELCSQHPKGPESLRIQQVYFLYFDVRAWAEEEGRWAAGLPALRVRAGAVCGGGGRLQTRPPGSSLVTVLDN